MFGINLLRRPSKFSLLVAMLTLAFMASGGVAAKHASASPTTSYPILITFETVWPNNIQDCITNDHDACSVAQVYGKFGAISSGDNHYQYRNMGLDSTPCEAFFPGTQAEGPCTKDMTNHPYDLSQTPLCYSQLTACTSDVNRWKTNSNTIVVHSRAGDSIFLDVLLKDYDPSIFDADDTICQFSNLNLGSHTEAELQNLNQHFTLSFPTRGDGGCTLFVSVKRLGL